MVPEAKLLLLLARAVVGPLNDDCALCAVKQCQYPELFVHWCRTAKMWPMVYQPLAMLFSHSRHPFLLESLHILQNGARRHCTRQAKRLETGFAVLDALFEKSEIPHIYLRGIPFAHRYYPKGVHRYCEDIDILIPAVYLKTATSAMLKEGYAFTEGPEKRLARASYMGQCEFYHKGGLCMVDLNWRLTGNCGIGPMDTDVMLVWQRSRQVSEFQYWMSDEDVMTELLRHAIHGHDFVQGVLRSCVDMDALLSTTSDLDWFYVSRQIEHTEMRRGCNFLGWFYTEIYRGIYREAVSKHLLAKHGLLARMENKLFCQWVIGPAMMPTPARTVLSEFKKVQRAMLAKAWAIDRIGRLMRVLLIPFIPSQEETLLLGDLDGRAGIVKGRLVARTKMLLVVPGFLFGLFLRVILGSMNHARGTVVEEEDGGLAAGREEGDPDVPNESKMRAKIHKLNDV